MADLRDTIYVPKDDLAGMSDNELFLAYHDNSHFAQCKVTAGLRLTPEARKYMLTDLERRKRLEAYFKAEEAKEKAIANGEIQNNGQSKGPDAGASHAADGKAIRRSNGPDDTGNAANLPGQSGEGTQSPGGTGAAGQGNATGADVQSNTAGGFAACDDTLAR